MIVFICLLSVVLLVGSVYLLAFYCHPDDKGFGSHVICKIAVVRIKI